MHVRSHLSECKFTAAELNRARTNTYFVSSNLSNVSVVPVIQPAYHLATLIWRKFRAEVTSVSQHNART